MDRLKTVNVDQTGKSTPWLRRAKSWPDGYRLLRCIAGRGRSLKEPDWRSNTLDSSPVVPREAKLSRLPVMINRLVDLPAASQRQPEVVMGLQAFGLGFQCLPVMTYRLVNLATAGQRDSEVAVGLSKIRLDLQGLAVMLNGLANLAVAGQDVAEVVVRLGVVRLDFQGLAVMGNRLVNLAVAGKDVAEVACASAKSGLILRALR